MGSVTELREVVDALESSLIGGRARWIADLTEFFRDYRTGDATFALYAKGSTRNRGLFLSRFFAWTVLPNYSVSLFCAYDEANSLSVERLRRTMEAVLRMVDEDGLQWAWLILLSQRVLSPEVVSFVSRYEKRELGIAVASALSRQVVLSNNQVGRSIEKHLRLSRVIGGTGKRRG